MLTSLAAKGFRGLADTTVGLAPFSVLIGPNGAGKTTVLDAIAAALSMAQPGAIRPGEFPRADGIANDEGIRNCVTRPAYGPPVVEIALRWADGMALTWTATSAVDDVDQVLLATHPSGVLARLSLEGRRLSGDPPTVARQVADMNFPGAIRLRPDRAALLRPSAFDDGGQATLAADGAGLAAVLAALNNRRRGELERVEGAVSTIVPQFRRILPVPIAWTEKHIEGGGSSQSANGDHVVLRRLQGWTFEAEMANGARLPASALSDGTLFALVLCTLLQSQAPGPKVLLLDDLDHGLHPMAQAEVVRMLQAQVTADNGLQVVATTHSPYLLDLFEPAAVSVLALGPAGFARCRCLADAPIDGRLRGVLQAGEIWAHAWEDWIFEAGSAT